MKITIAQALATVLGVDSKIVHTPEPRQAFILKGNGLEIQLGWADEMSLDQAVFKAVETVSFSQEAAFAIFPIASHREDFYMGIERELLRQEGALEGPMYKQLGVDPREVIMACLEQLRVAGATVMNPLPFQRELLRAGVVLVAGLQWADNWIAEMRMRQATLATQQPNKIVEMPTPSEREGIPPVNEEQLNKTLEANGMCIPHGTKLPCKDCDEENETPRS